jgi:DNA-directed RNA polymerase specialized sigma24 family protein
MSVVSFEVVEGSEVQDLFETYGPRLLAETALWRVPPDERMSVVLTVLNDVVLRILKTGNEPDYMPAYLYAALRNRLRNRYRDNVRKKRFREAACAAIAWGGESFVSECHSQFGRESSYPLAVFERADSRPEIVALAHWIEARLTRRDLDLIHAIGNGLPQSAAAGELAITAGTARVRLHRLRNRIRRWMCEYVATLDSPEAEEVARFVRRVTDPTPKPKISEREALLKRPAPIQRPMKVDRLERTVVEKLPVAKKPPMTEPSLPDWALALHAQWNAATTNKEIH